MHQLSRMYVRELVKTDRVLVNGEITNVGRRINSNDYIELEADMSRGTAMRPEFIPVDIVFEDDSIIVVDKPAGMLVHPTHRDKNGTLLNALSHHLNKDHFRQSGEDAKREAAFVRPGLVHRLDRETSGLIVVAKTIAAHRRLAADFMKKRVEKRYTALVEGRVSKDEGVIDLPVGRYNDKKHWDVKHDGKHAVTRFVVRDRSVDTSLVELQPVTGRTNQLRIHCSSIGHAIVGDTRRGGRPFERLCLHAERLGFCHPITREYCEFGSRSAEFDKFLVN
jgi:23S rRNA pseudouridine1911/1915/1917 synthase